MSVVCRIVALCAVVLSISPCSAARNRYIRDVQPIAVQCAVGNAPSLPSRVWVTYTDGSAEWRQVRWSNSFRQIEEAQADSTLHPAGSHYSVEGYVLGDNTTPQGFPLQAQVNVVQYPLPVPSPRPVARTLPLRDVQLTGDNRLIRNRDLDIRQLLSLDVAQQLYNYRDTYGLPTQGYPESDGWDSPTTKLKGHGTGHYLSALALAFASAPTDSVRDQLRQRIRRMVNELRQCQERTFVWNDSLGRYWEARDIAPQQEVCQLQATWDAFNSYKLDPQHYGYGYLNAIPPQHVILTEAYRPYNNESGIWAPYYTIHKQLAGLIDIALNVDDTEIADKALLIAKDMGLWVWNRLHHRTFVQTEGTQAERRSRPGNRFEMWNMYIAGEVGGMAESLARLSEMVTDSTSKARLLEAANCFDAPAFFQPLSRNIDDIRTRHANQHIPMITGALRTYLSNGDAYYYRLARNFWDLLQERYTYAMGGVGNGEMFRQPYGQVLDEHINETCCAYNLAKLTKDLNCYTPDDAALMDYYERLLYNQIVGSLHPTHYGVTYQYAVGLNAAKPFGNETPQSTCCGGTGAENHVKYQEAAYFVSDADSILWVALYLPTQALWREQGVTIHQDCQWPAERTTIRVSGGGEFAMRLRIPYWATKGFEVCLNGKRLAANDKLPLKGAGGSYIELPRRRWSDTDLVEVDMPYQPHIHFHPDKMQFAPQWVGAFMLGPLVMATPDITSWDDAVVSLRKIENGKWIPDYAITDQHTTHYLRLDMGKIRRDVGKSQSQTEWEQLMVVARERVADSLSWAPHGLARLKKAMTANDLSSLRTVINTMRPSTLAEPEDLTELLTLLSKAKSVSNKSTELREAIEYADMVVHYVNDGSGTHDLIQKAVLRLRSTAEQFF